MPVSIIILTSLKMPCFSQALGAGCSWSCLEGMQLGRRICRAVSSGLQGSRSCQYNHQGWERRKSGWGYPKLGWESRAREAFTGRHTIASGAVLAHSWKGVRCQLAFFLLAFCMEVLLPPCCQNALPTIQGRTNQPFVVFLGAVKTPAGCSKAGNTADGSNTHSRKGQTGRHTTSTTITQQHSLDTCLLLVLRTSHLCLLLPGP